MPLRDQPVGQIAVKFEDAQRGNCSLGNLPSAADAIDEVGGRKYARLISRVIQQRQLVHWVHDHLTSIAEILKYSIE